MSKAKNVQLESAVPVPTPDGMESLGGNVFVVKLSQTPGGPAYPVLGKNMMQGTVDYGKKNDFPQQIIRLNNGSPTNAAIIDSKVTYILGKGVIASKTEDAKLVGVPNPGETWDSVIDKIARDYCTFGGRSFQVILNNDGVSISVYHQDFSQVRVGKFTDKGKVETYKISDDWSDSTKKPIELPAWDGNVSSMSKGQAYLYYAFDYRPGLKFYPVPSYYSAMEYVKADGALSLFYNASIKNGFTGSAVIVMPFNADEKTQKAFYEDLRRNLTGPENGNNVFVIWGENASGVAPQISPFNASNNADVYNNVQNIVFQSIVSAHRLSSPTLAGISGTGNLSGNASEIIDSFILFNYTVIENLRRVILDDLNVVQKINKRQPLQINELDVVKKIRESESASEQILTIKDGSAGPDNVESLASKLGVGGTQALSGILESRTMSETLKRGILSEVFGLTTDQVNNLFQPNEDANAGNRFNLRRFISGK